MYFKNIWFSAYPKPDISVYAFIKCTKVQGNHPQFQVLSTNTEESITCIPFIYLKILCLLDSYADLYGFRIIYNEDQIIYIIRIF